MGLFLLLVDSDHGDRGGRAEETRECNAWESVAAVVLSIRTWTGVLWQRIDY